MQKVKVGLEKHSYDILIGHGLIKNSGQIIAPLLSKNRVVVITDQNVAEVLNSSCRMDFGAKSRA